MFLCALGFSPLDKEVRDLDKARTCAFQANYHLFWTTKYRRKVLLGSVEVYLEELLNCRLLTAKVHDGDHVYVFVSAPPKVSIPEKVRVFKCISAKALFLSLLNSRVSCGVGICGQRVTLLELQAMLLAQRSKNVSTESKPR
jgi:hypothetical protein